MESDFDVVVIGTSLVESILAAAFARAGKKVLYVDDARWYGSQHATLSFGEFNQVLESKTAPRGTTGSDLDGGGRKLLSVLSGSSSLATVQHLETHGEAPKVRLNDYNIDLTARLLFCRGQSVDVLAESGVSRYMEFQTMDGTFYVADDGSQTLTPVLVPQSKSQVFSSTLLSMVEKRQLMRFLQFCMDYRQTQEKEDRVEWTNERLGALNPGRSLVRPQNKSEDSDLRDKATECGSDTLESFLQQSVRMSGKLCDIVQYGIAQQECSASKLTVRHGMARVGKYLSALGRFGSTPFLTPMYGLGELCQGFSRLCAVYGGLCALGVQPRAIYEDGVSFRSNPTAQAEDDDARYSFPPFIRFRQACIVNAAFLGLNDAFSPEAYEEMEVRCVGILNRSIFAAEFSRTFFVVPPADSDDYAVHGIQLDSRARVVPDGQYLLHLTTRTPTRKLEATKQKLEGLLERLVASAIQLNRYEMGEDPIVRWHATFTRKLYYDSSPKENVYVVGDGARSPSAHQGQALDVELDGMFARAEAIFKSVCPDQDFLPPSETEVRTRQEEQAEMGMPDFA